MKSPGRDMHKRRTKLWEILFELILEFLCFIGWKKKRNINSIFNSTKTTTSRKITDSIRK